MNDKEISFLLSLQHSHTWNHTISLSFNTASMRLPISNTPVLRLTHTPVPPAQLGKEVERNLRPRECALRKHEEPHTVVLWKTLLNHQFPREEKAGSHE